MDCSVYSIKRIFYIGCECEVDRLQFLNVIPRAMFGKGIHKCPQHTDTGITRSTATKTDNDMLCSSPDGICYQLPRPIACSHHWVAFLL